MYYRLITKNRQTLINLTKVVRIILDDKIIIFETGIPNITINGTSYFKYHYDTKEDAEKEFNLINKELK